MEELFLKWTVKVLFLLLFFSKYLLPSMVTHAHSVADNQEQQLEFPLECIKAVIEEVANHDSKQNILSGETNLSEVSKAVFHEA